jgi:hypothetical protein
MSVRRRAGHSEPPREHDAGVQEIVKKVKALDVYPKTLSEFSERTDAGGLISVCAISLIVLLIFSQLAAYFQTTVVDHLSVDVERERLIRINLNITFPALPCAGIGLVTMDVAGEQQIDVVQNLFKTRLLPTGERLVDGDGGDGDDGSSGGGREDGNAVVRMSREAALEAVGLAGLAEGDERCGLCYMEGEIQALFKMTVTQQLADAHANGRRLPPVRAFSGEAGREGSTRTRLEECRAGGTLAAGGG